MAGRRAAGLAAAAGGGVALSGRVCRRRHLLHLAVHGRILMSLACSPLVAYARKAARLWGHIWSAHDSDVVGKMTACCLSFRCLGEDQAGTGIPLTQQL